MRSLLSRFEAPAPVAEAPQKERVKSTVDAPRAAIFGEAARVRDEARSMSTGTGKGEKARPVSLPRECATDTDEVRQIKRAIVARDQEIRDAVVKLDELSNRLEKLVDQFSSSVVADDLPPPTSATAEGAKASSPVLAFSGDHDASPRAVAPQQSRPERMSATSSAPISLEAILAAARSGKSAGTTERPKYAKLLRDMK